MNAHTQLERMQSAYGTNHAKHCSGCCNCQPRSRGSKALFCTGYGAEYCLDWNPDFYACGLYNKAFLGIRPRLRPLGELYDRPAAKEDSEQISLF